jgi:hypothetical protein
VGPWKNDKDIVEFIRRRELTDQLSGHQILVVKALPIFLVDLRTFIELQA